jgi:hypothetical protein
MYLKEMELDVMHWINLAQFRDKWLTLVNRTLKIRVS